MCAGTPLSACMRFSSTLEMTSFPIWMNSWKNYSSTKPIYRLSETPSSSSFMPIRIRRSNTSITRSSPRRIRVHLEIFFSCRFSNSSGKSASSTHPRNPSSLNPYSTSPNPNPHQCSTNVPTRSARFPWQITRSNWPWPSTCNWSIHKLTIMSSWWFWIDLKSSRNRISESLRKEYST